ncbi:MAG: lipopolysaccharide biosynthesis protein [Sarcina sp.]
MVEKIKKLMTHKLGKNFIVLLFGSGIGSVLTLLNLTIILRTIGENQNGQLIMIQTYTSLFIGIFSFKSFEALIKHLSITIQKEDKESSKRYIKFSFILDISSIILATIFSYFFINFIFDIMKWPQSLKIYVYIYIVTILFSATGTATGIIRIFNGYNRMVTIGVIISFIKFIFYFIGFFKKETFAYFFFIEFFAAIITNIAIVLQSLYILYKEDLWDFYKHKFSFDKEYFMFNVYSSLYTTLDIPVQEITTFIINRYLGFSDVTIYNIFGKIGSIVLKVEAPLSQIIYPEMNIRIANNEKSSAVNLYKKLFKLISLIGGAFALILIATYGGWMSILVNNKWLYFIPFAMYILYIVYTSASRTIHDLFISLGYIKTNVVILFIINIIYLIILALFASNIGLIGVILALILQAVAVIEIKKWILRRDNHF